MTLKLGGQRGLNSCKEDVALIRSMFSEYETLLETASKYSYKNIAKKLNIDVSTLGAALNQGLYAKERWHPEAIRLNKIRKNLRARAKEVGPAHIANTFGVSESHIYSIVRGAKWKTVEDKSNA